MVLVMDNGLAAEWGRPASLLDNPNGTFTSMPFPPLPPPALPSPPSPPHPASLTGLLRVCCVYGITLLHSVSSTLSQANAVLSISISTLADCAAAANVRAAESILDTQAHNV